MLFGNEYGNILTTERIPLDGEPTDTIGLIMNPNNNINTIQNTSTSHFILPNFTFVLQPSIPIDPIQLNVPYTILEILVAIVAIIGNAMVIYVFYGDRRLRRRTNYYIVSLAVADLLVGLLGIPFAILASIGLPKNLYTCLFTVSLLVVLCTISIFCLVAVSVDRYWAILYPLAYSKNVSAKTAIVIISFCWFLGTIVGFLPLFGWHKAKGEVQSCFFVQIMDYNYLVFLYVATIITPAILLFAFYVHIYTVIIKQVRQTVTYTRGDKSFLNGKTKLNGGGMLRVLSAARKREVKATQNLSSIVLFFMLCWLPLYTINCIQAFCPQCFIDEKITFAAIILSHLNSAVNPLLYAYNLKDFRAALKALMYRMVCKEIQQQNINYGFSIASQQRIQALIEKQPTLIRPRKYVDSPVWQHEKLQAKQNRLQNTDSSNSLNQIIPIKSKRHNNVDGPIWNIAEIASISNGSDDSNSAYCSPSSKQFFPINESTNHFQLVDRCLDGHITTKTTTTTTTTTTKPATNNIYNKREYSFNYDNLDRDGMPCTYSNHSPEILYKTSAITSSASTLPDQIHKHPQKLITFTNYCPMNMNLSINPVEILTSSALSTQHNHQRQQINQQMNVQLENVREKPIEHLPIDSTVNFERQKSLPSRLKTISLEMFDIDLSTVSQTMLDYQHLDHYQSCSSKPLIRSINDNRNKNNEQRLNVKDLFRLKLYDENSNKFMNTAQLKRTKSDSDCTYEKLSLSTDDIIKL